MRNYCYLFLFDGVFVAVKPDGLCPVSVSVGFCVGLSLGLVLGHFKTIEAFYE